MIKLLIQLMFLTRSLYPTGRVTRLNERTIISRVHDAINISQAQLIEDSKAILDTVLADNENFSAEDATTWERRLAIISGATDLEIRKDAILRKYAHPGNIPARQHYLYLQEQLQSAGFDVYVHENAGGEFPGDFPFYTQNNWQLNQFQLGQVSSGSTPINLVANGLTQLEDLSFSIGPDPNHVFFIGGEIKGDPANVDQLREKEFRQIILSVKPSNTVACLFINYV